jgi:hypothetical protein
MTEPPEIGKFCLTNHGAFVVKLQFVYYDPNFVRHHVDGTDRFFVNQTKCRAPGQSGVPEGYIVSLFAYVRWGIDRTAAQLFTYREASPLTATYKITGTTLTSKLEFTGIKEAAPATL